jgi:hypothetical protein
MSITRIQNNQITDSTIVAYAKLQSGSLTGNLFAPSVTLNSNVTINGNLFLANTGNTATINATNTYINDPIVVFNNGYGGSLSGYDIGMLVNRNLTSMAPYGSQVNTAWVWVENDQAFEAITTSDTGTGTTSINSLGFANVKIGNTTMVSATISGALTAGSTTFSTLTTGGLQAVAIGNVTPGTAAFTTLSTSGVTTHSGNVVITSGTDVTAASGVGALMITGSGGASIASNVSVGNNLYVGGSGAFGQSLASAGIVVSKSGAQYAQIALKNTTNTGSADYAAYADNGSDAGGWVDMGVAGSTFNDPSYTITKAQDGYLITRPTSNTYGGNLVIGTSEAGSFNDITLSVGSFFANAEVARFHGNTSTNGYLALKQGTAATSTTSGALQVSGGVGISGAAWVGGLINVAGAATLQSSLGVTGVTTLTTATVGGLQVVAIGNVTPGTAQFTTLGASGTSTLNTITGASLQAVAIGNVTPGTGAFTTGTFSSTLGVTGVTTLTTATVGGLQAVAIGNVTPGTGNFTSLNTTGTFTAATVNALTLGNVGATIYGTGTNITALSAANINGTVATANVSYYDAITASTTNATFYPAFFDKTSGNGQNWVSSSLTYNASTGALSATTFSGAGAFTTGTFSSTLGVTGVTTLTTATTGGLQAVAIGNVTPGTGAFTTVTAQTETVGGLQAVAIGNVTPGTGAFTAGTFNTATTGGLQAIAIGNVTPGTASFTTATTGGLQAVAIGNVTPGTGAFTTVTGGSFQGIVGNATPATAFFTTANATNVYAATIGNVGTTLNGSLSGASVTGTVATSNVSLYDNVSTSTTNAVYYPQLADKSSGNVATVVATGVNVNPSTSTISALAFTGGSGAFTSLNASGVTQITNGTSATGVGTGALIVTGGASVGGNLFVSGNVYASSIVGVTQDVITIQDPLIYLQALGNLATYNYDIGFYSDYTQGRYAHTGLARNFSTNTWNFFSNVVSEPDVAGINWNDVGLAWDNVKAGQLVLANTTASTSSTTGALQVTGGAGILGSAYIGGGVQNTPVGNATPNTGAFTTLSATGASTLNTVTGASFQGVIGNVTPNTGAFTTATATTVNAATIGNSGAVLYGTLNSASASQTNITSVGTLTGLTVSGATSLNTATGASFQGVIGNVTPNTGAFTTATATTVNAATIGNTGATLTGTLSTAAQTNITSVGALTGLTVSGSSSLNTVTGASFQGIIGNVTPASATFTTVTTGSLTTAALNNTVIGNVTPTTAFFTTANATNLYAATIGNIGTTLNGTLAASSVAGTVATANVSMYDSISATTTNATFYPQIVDKASGNVATYSAANFTINPSTGALSATSFNGIGTFSTATTSGTFIASGNIVAAASTASTSTTTGALVVPNGGIGATGNLNIGTTNTSLHMIYGNTVIGSGVGATSNIPSLLINQNSSTPFNSTSVLHVAAASNVSGKISIDSVGTNVTSMIVARSARGTAATPSASQSGDTLGALLARGYGSTGFFLANAASSTGMQITATENFSDTTQGTGIFFNAVPNGSRIAVPVMSMYGNTVVSVTGALTVGNGISSIGSLTAQANLSVIGSSNFSNIANFNGLVTIANTTPTNNTTSGALVVQGGIATSGNINTGGQFFVGAGSQTTVLTGAISVARGTSSTGAGTQYTQSALINATNTGSSDFVAYANNYAGPSSDHGWVDLGFTGDAFNDPTYSITKANDGYLFSSAANATVGGNLVLSTDYTGGYNDIVLGVGSFYANSEVARFHGNTSNSGTFVLKLPTTNTLSANTGALQVWGGTSISGNIYVGGSSYQMGGALFNHNQASAGATGAFNQNAFIMQGVNDSTLIYAKPLTAYDAVIIGGNGASTAFAQGAKLVVNSTDSMIIPTGTSAQRPSSTGGTDTVGMLRYNTTTASLEFYDGTAWQAPSSAITVITDQQFTATGSTAAFTLSGATTTASTIVSINGVMQIPTLAYSVSGSTLTFTENPANGDVIDVRVLTTTSTISQLNDISGLNTVQTLTAASSAGNVGVLFTTGVAGGGSIRQYGIDTAGGMVTLSPNVTVSTAGVATTVDSLFANNYSSAKYTITATIQGTNIREISEILMVHNGSAAGAGTATVMSYGRVSTSGNTLVTWGATTSGNIAQLQATTTNANTILRIKRDYQAI